MKSSDEDRGVRVWDVPVRLFHWLLVVLLIVLGISGKFGGMDLDLMLPGGHGFYLTNMDVHMWSGQAVLALVFFRVLWGLAGSSTARFAAFVRGPKAAASYLLAMLRGQLPPSVGHNPAGGWMVMLMLGLLLLQSGTGLFASDDLFSEGPLAHLLGSEASARITSWHGDIFNVLLGAVGLHIAVILYYLARGRNLIGAMLTGRKSLAQIPTEEAADLRQAPWWLAVVLLAVAGGAVWGLRLL